MRVSRYAPVWKNISESSGQIKKSSTTKASEITGERNAFIKCHPDILKERKMLKKYLGRRELDGSGTWLVYNIFLRC